MYQHANAALFSLCLETSTTSKQRRARSSQGSFLYVIGGKGQEIAARIAPSNDQPALNEKGT